MKSVLIVGLVVQALLSIFVLVQWLMERQRLGRFVEDAAKGLAAAAASLDEPHQSIALKLHKEVEASKRDDDEALLDAIADAASQSFRPSLAVSAGVILALTSSVFAPLLVGAFAAASAVVRSTPSGTPSRSLLAVQDSLRSAFELLHGSLQSVAILGVGACLFVGITWLLFRPEVREARFVHALLMAMSRAPEPISAPCSGRLAEFVAPERGLPRALRAGFVLIAGISLGWTFLLASAHTRATNRRPTLFRMWDPSAKISAGGVKLPIVNAGRPLGITPGLSLVVDRQSIRIGRQQVSPLEEGRLPQEGWPPTIEDCAGAKQMSLIGEAAIPVSTVLETVRLIAEGCGADQFDIIAERRPRAQPRRQAILPIRVRAEPAFTTALILEANAVRFEGKTFNCNDQGLSAFRAAVGQWRLANRDAHVIALQLLDPQMSFETFTEVLATIDSNCLGPEECGLPGHGTEFLLSI